MKHFRKKNSAKNSDTSPEKGDSWNSPRDKFNQPLPSRNNPTENSSSKPQKQSQQPPKVSNFSNISNPTKFKLKYHNPNENSKSIFENSPRQGPSPLSPSKKNLGLLLENYGVTIDTQQLELLWAYHQLLRKHNTDQDLTRLINFDSMAQRHYADCLVFSQLIQNKWPSPLLDVGTGAGFPGFMIKIASPQTEIILAEPRPRRVNFLNLVIKELGFQKIHVFGHKVTSKSYLEPVQGIVSRAFETVASTLPRIEPALQIGGKAIFMKGPKLAEELEELKPVHQSSVPEPSETNPNISNSKCIQSGRALYTIETHKLYRIPNTQQDRALLILRRDA